MYRIYHIPEKGKQKGQEVATNFWHRTAKDAEALCRWWTRCRYERWFYKEEPLPDNVELRDFGSYLYSYSLK